VFGNINKNMLLIIKFLHTIIRSLYLRTHDLVKLLESKTTTVKKGSNVTTITGSLSLFSIV
jgi:hypothetical protein